MQRAAKTEHSCARYCLVKSVAAPSSAAHHRHFPLGVALVGGSRLDKTLTQGESGFWSARQLPLQPPSGPAQVRWVSPRSVDMHELACWKFDAASLCAGLQHHFGRRSTSPSRRAPRETRSWQRDREAVGNARCQLQLDLARFENRPPSTRRKHSTWRCQVASPCTARTPGRSAIGRSPCPATARPPSQRQRLHSGISRSRSGSSHERLLCAC